MRGRGLLGAAATLLWLAPSVLPAQEGSGEINGFVRAAGSNQPVQGTLVQLQSDMGEIIQQTTAEGTGRFQFSSLRRQLYYVNARAPGYRETTQRADLFTLRRVTVQLFLVRDKEDPPALPAALSVVDERQLRIPEAARREFQDGARELLEKHHPDLSLLHFRKAVELYPEYYEACHLMGTAYMDLNQWPEAESALQRALTLKPEYPPSLFALGALYNRQGKPVEAASVLERGLQAQPESWQGHFELSQSLLVQGKPAEATQHLQRAHRLEPTAAPVLHILLGNLYLRQGLLPAAKAEYQHFLDLAPDSPMAAEVRQKLAEVDTVLSKKPQ